MDTSNSNNTTTICTLLIQLGLDLLDCFFWDEEYRTCSRRYRNIFKTIPMCIAKRIIYATYNEIVNCIKSRFYIICLKEIIMVNKSMCCHSYSRIQPHQNKVYSVIFIKLPRKKFFIKIEAIDEVKRKKQQKRTIS